MDLRRPCIEEKFHEFAARVPAHDGVVYDDDAPTLYHRGERVELGAQAELAHTIRRLYERPADVAVLYEALGIGYAAPLQYPTAAEIPESGTGMTTSASAGASSASSSPILPRALRPPARRSASRDEQKCTYSKTHRAGRGLSRWRAVQARIVYDDDLAQGNLTGSERR